jgi:AraC-like DNA-binding protein
VNAFPIFRLEGNVIIRKFEPLNRYLQNLRIEIKEICSLDADKEWNFPIHSSPFNRLYFVTGGIASISDGKSTIMLQKGNMYLIPVNAPYALRCEKSMQKIYVHFTAEILPGHDIFEENRVCICHPFAPDMAERLVGKLESHSPGDFLEIQSLLFEAMSHLLVPPAEGLEEWFSMLLKYKDLYRYVKDNCHANISIGELASALYMSPTTLSKAFRADMGYSLKSYLNRKLIDKIKEYLVLTDLGLKEISRLLMFSDEFYLSNFFKKQVGVSPKAYKNSQI